MELRAKVTGLFHAPAPNLKFQDLSGLDMRLREITHADRVPIRLRSEAVLPYQGIPAKPPQSARRTRTGIQAARPPQPPQPPPRPIPPTPPDPPEPPQPPSKGGEYKPPKQAKQPKPVIKGK